MHDDDRWTRPRRDTSRWSANPRECLSNAVDCNRRRSKSLAEKDHRSHAEWSRVHRCERSTRTEWNKPPRQMPDREECAETCSSDVHETRRCREVDWQESRFRTRRRSKSECNRTESIADCNRETHSGTSHTTRNESRPRSTERSHWRNGSNERSRVDRWDRQSTATLIERASQSLSLSQSNGQWLSSNKQSSMASPSTDTSARHDHLHEYSLLRTECLRWTCQRQFDLRQWIHSYQSVTFGVR